MPPVRARRERSTAQNRDHPESMRHWHERQRPLADGRARGEGVTCAEAQLLERDATMCLMYLAVMFVSFIAFLLIGVFLDHIWFFGAVIALVLLIGGGIARNRRREAG